MLPAPSGPDRGCGGGAARERGGAGPRGRGETERACRRLRFRSEAFAESPASLGGGGGRGGGGGSGGIRKSTPCRVCTRAGKGRGGRPSHTSPRQAAPSALQRGAQVRPGVGDPLLPVEGLGRPLSNLIACGPERARSGGTSFASRCHPIPLSLILDPGFPSCPRVFLIQGLDALFPSSPSPTAPVFVSPVNPLPQYPPLQMLPVPLARFLQGKLENLDSPVSPPPGQIPQHRPNFAHSSIFLHDLFFKPFVLACG